LTSVLGMAVAERKWDEFSNYPFGLLQPHLGLLHKNYSDSTPFQEALGVLRVSHKELSVFLSSVCLMKLNVPTLSAYYFLLIYCSFSSMY
jgi:hypothetical protein